MLTLKLQANLCLVDVKKQPAQLTEVKSAFLLQYRGLKRLDAGNYQPEEVIESTINSQNRY